MHDKLLNQDSEFLVNMVHLGPDAKCFQNQLVLRFMGGSGISLYFLGSLN